MKIPKYMLDFKCIGGICEDNCCIGWDVDIDQVTYKKYKKIDNKALKPLIQKNLHINTQCSDKQIDYAFVTLDRNKRCGFLSEENLCNIQKHCGESFLSNVCANYPRMTHRIDGIFECSATLSCPEVARKALETADAMSLVDVPDPKGFTVLTYDLSQNSSGFEGTLLKDLRVIRDACFHVFDYEKNGSTSIEHRLRVLGDMIVNLRKIEKSGHFQKVGQIIDYNVNKHKILHSDLSKQDTIKPVDTAFEDLIHDLYEGMGSIGTTDSRRFDAYVKRAKAGQATLGWMYFKAFLEDSPHVMNNYFQNHIYKALFPFSEGKDIEEAYVLLLSRYALIKSVLSTLGDAEQGLDRATVVDFLQAFSKLIEHHKRFESEMPGFLSKKGWDLNRLMAVMLMG